MDGLEWEKDGRYWPNRDHSRFVSAGATVWHVQRMGQGPALLLLHGTAASTHSWAGLMPKLARRFDVIAVDLPGHGFTRSRHRGASDLAGMAAAVGALMDVLQVAPVCLVGHSAGAAVALQMVLDGRAHPGSVISLNGALVPFEGAASVMFPLLAKMIHFNPVSAHALAWAARDRSRVRRLIEQTGSYAPELYVDLYAVLLRSPRHIAGALAMMANWDLSHFASRLGRVDIPVHLFVATGDRAVPPAQAEAAAQRLRQAQKTTLQGLGHLAHEEDPQNIADLIVAALAA